MYIAAITAQQISDVLSGICLAGAILVFLWGIYYTFFRKIR